MFLNTHIYKFSSCFIYIPHTLYVIDEQSCLLFKMHVISCYTIAHLTVINTK